MKVRVAFPGSAITTARQPGRTAAKRAALLSAALLALFVFETPAFAQIDDSPPSLRGTRGLIATPSARMAPDGELSIGASFLKNNQHYNLGFQILPWLEGSFVYSGLQNFVSGYPVYYDRAFGMKARLWNEGTFMPAVAVGIDDIVGTGIFNGEYVVASKRFGDFDASLGIGWGRRAETELFRNPIAAVISSYENRQSYFGQAGQADFKAFFHGPKVGLFGGVVWHTPLEGLSASIEYDSDRYTLEKGAGNLSPRSQINYGLSYKLSDQAVVGLDWLYGTTLGGSFSLRMDPVHPQYVQKIVPPTPELTVRTPGQRQEALAALLQKRDPRSAAQRRLFDARNTERNLFVDTLWRSDSGYSNVEVRQSMLDLTLTGPISSTNCAAIARLAQSSALQLTQIRLHDSTGRRSVACRVPQAPQAPLTSAVFLSSENPATAPLTATPVLTIDASAVKSRTQPTQSERAIKDALAKQNLFVETISFGEGEITIYYRNYHYQAETDALDRIVRVLSKEAPPDIERFRLIAVSISVPVQEFNILRAPAERSYQQEAGDIFDNSMSMAPPSMSQPALAAAAEDIYPRFSWGVYPQFRQALFDPNQPFGVQFLAAAYAGVELAPGWTFGGSLEASLFDDFNTARASDSLLPHVRSDFLRYFTRGKTGIGNLETDYRFRLSPNIFGKTRIGYLEGMFAGVGGEILWRPEGARWALGADVYQVWQRDFDRLLGLQRYHQTTGHISFYYDSPWYDLNFQLRAGQYLTGDRGLTLQITRRFTTGVEIGAFVTKTNVSAAQFGEGSFDKGIVIRIPLGWIAPIESQSQLTMDLRPVQRDGGQTLIGDATLYDETRPTSQGEILRSLASRVPP